MQTKEEYKNYIIFILGRDLFTKFLPLENDLAYEKCKELANEFIGSNYDDSSKNMYDCLEEFVQDKKNN